MNNEKAITGLKIAKFRAFEFSHYFEFSPPKADSNFGFDRTKVRSKYAILF